MLLQSATFPVLYLCSKSVTSTVRIYHLGGLAILNEETTLENKCSYSRNTMTLGRGT